MFQNTSTKKAWSFYNIELLFLTFGQDWMLRSNYDGCDWISRLSDSKIYAGDQKLVWTVQYGKIQQPRRTISFDSPPFDAYACYGEKST